MAVEHVARPVLQAQRATVWLTRTDSEFRRLPQFHRAVELVRNGRIGKECLRSCAPGG
jgi:hypothetical protein